MRSRESGLDLTATAPNGQAVSVQAVPRGYPLRRLECGPGQLAGDIAASAIDLVHWALAQRTTTWTIGVISPTEESWLGVRRFHLERCPDADPEPRVLELVRQVESGQLPIPPARDRSPRRAAPGT